MKTLLLESCKREPYRSEAGVRSALEIEYGRGERDTGEYDRIVLKKEGDCTTRKDYSVASSLSLFALRILAMFRISICSKIS